MKFNFKKSFGIVLENPQIMLVLIAFMLIFASLFQMTLPAILKVKSTYYLFMGLFTLLTAAFLSGWFGMIKTAVSYKPEGNTEEDFLKRHISFKGSFFGSVPVYTISITLLIIFFIILNYALPMASEVFFGRADDLLKEIYLNSADTYALLNMFKTMSPENLNLLIQRSIFLTCGFLLYFLFTMFSVPALYAQNKKNAFGAVVQSISAVFKHPFHSVCILGFLFIAHIILLIFEAVCIQVNSIASFVSMVIRIYFIVYAVVLIFSVYEESFCNNGNDSLREDGTCD